MAILKPNIPLKYVKPDGTTQSEYPLTSIDQVIDEDGIHRLNQTIVRADLSDVEEGQVVPTNADLLDNHPASYFANKSDVDNAIEELNTAIANSGKFYGIDTKNILESWGSFSSHTASASGWLVVAYPNNYNGRISIDGVRVAVANGNDCTYVPIKAGQVISIRKSSDNSVANASSGTIYGLKE